MKVAVIIPTLNESASLPRTLMSLQQQTRPPDQIMVIDGGSSDDTLAVARSLGVESQIWPERGRGGQIAAGVAGLTEDVIVVAHADMVFPSDALETIEAYLHRHAASPGGCLGHRFDHSAWIYRVIEWCDRRRAMGGYSFGDQAQFFRLTSLERVGGFPNLPLMEDVELARRLRMLGRPAYLHRPVTVSARRFERHGWLRAICSNWQLRRLYRREGEVACWRMYHQYYGRRPTSAARKKPID